MEYIAELTKKVEEPASKVFIPQSKPIPDIKAALPPPAEAPPPITCKVEPPKSIPKYRCKMTGCLGEVPKPVPVPKPPYHRRVPCSMETMCLEAAKEAAKKICPIAAKNPYRIPADDPKIPPNPCLSIITTNPAAAEKVIETAVEEIEKCCKNKVPSYNFKDIFKGVERQPPPPPPPRHPKRPDLTEDDIKKVRENEEAVFKKIVEVFHIYKTDEVLLSFNGGKDCTVILHLLAKFYRNKNLQHYRLPVLYIQSDDNFDEIEKFVKECEENYEINLIRRKGPIKKVLEEYCKENPKMKAVFMGNRRTDPFCENLKWMQPTDPGWPPLMRFNPIIDWSYKDIWNYIFVNNMPYCILYDQGYSSIGSKTNTKKNPKLRANNPEGCNTSIESYLPAFALEDADKYERAGRESKDSQFYVPPKPHPYLNPELES